MAFIVGTAAMNENYHDKQILHHKMFHVIYAINS